MEEGAAGVDWRQKLETQRGAVLATELKNNANKLAKWTASALIAGADMIKLGYVSRVHPKDNFTHVILGTQVGGLPHRCTGERRRRERWGRGRGGFLDAAQERGGGVGRRRGREGGTAWTGSSFRPLQRRGGRRGTEGGF